MNKQLITALTMGSLLLAGLGSASAQTSRSQLSREDITALKEARLSGDQEAAMAILERNGMDAPFQNIRSRRGQEGNRFNRGENSFKPSLEGLSEEDQAALKAAHEAKDKEAAKEILERNGIELPERLKEGNEKLKERFESLSEEDQAALKAAHEAKDHQAAMAIFERNGMEIPERLQKIADMKAAMESMSEEDKAALEAAKESRDREAAEAILDKYGIERPDLGKKGVRAEGGNRNLPRYGTNGNGVQMSVEDITSLREALESRNVDLAKEILSKYRK